MPPAVALRDEAPTKAKRRSHKTDNASVKVRGQKTSKAKAKDALSLRVDDITRELIDRAAIVLGQTRTEFMVNSARDRAIDVLLDQTLFRLNRADWDAFNKALDEPPLPNAELKALLASKPPWEQ